MEDNRTERLAKLLDYLQDNTPHTIDELAMLLNTTQSVVSSDIAFLKASGYQLHEATPNGYQFISDDPTEEGGRKTGLEDLAPGEDKMLMAMLDNLPISERGRHILKTRLIAHFGLEEEGERLLMSKYAIIETLLKAIGEQFCTALHDTRVDGVLVPYREVEPFMLYPNNLYGYYSDYTAESCGIWAWDRERGCNTYVHLNEISYATLLDTPWEHIDEHSSLPMDGFNCQMRQGLAPVHLLLELTPEAQDHLVENYPLTVRDIVMRGGVWFFEGMVYNMKKVERFLDLFPEVMILEKISLDNLQA